MAWFLFPLGAVLPSVRTIVEYGGFPGPLDLFCLVVFSFAAWRARQTSKRGPLLAITPEGLLVRVRVGNKRVKWKDLKKLSTQKLLRSTILIIECADSKRLLAIDFLTSEREVEGFIEQAEAAKRYYLGGSDGAPSAEGKS